MERTGGWLLCLLAGPALAKGRGLTPPHRSLLTPGPRPSILSPSREAPQRPPLFLWCQQFQAVPGLEMGAFVLCHR